MATKTGIRQMIHGVEVSFPCKPYPSQFSMMEKVIKGIERKQNCLLESPTGSGKSLALLCSALAWQKAEFEKKAREESNMDIKKDGKCTCSRSKEESEKPSKDCSSIKNDMIQGVKRAIIGGAMPEKADDMDDFRDVNSFQGSVSMTSTKNGSRHQPIMYDTSPPAGVPGSNLINSGKHSESSEDGSCCCSCSSDKTPSRKVPKIYFGTRTHKQISQIARELKKTVYKEARMTILAAREHTCIHREVSKTKNKNEGCKELLDGPGCKFNDRVKRVLPSQSYLKKHGLVDAWDIEEFVGLCSTHSLCPYYATRGLKKDADIVFCPYNYLIDPVVRQAMEISLKDQIIILDEGHNIEDCARDSAGDSFKEDQLEKAIKEFDEMIKYDIKVSEHLRIRQMCSGFQRLITDNVHNLKQMDFDQEYIDWSGFDIVARLDQIGIGPKHATEIKRCMIKIMEDLGDRDTIIRDVAGKEIKLSSPTCTLLEHISKILDYMYRLDLKFVPDYRMAVVKSTVYTRNLDTDDTWLNPRQRRRAQPTTQYALNFWCMNPGVAFSDFTVCRNVVLTSGTLSPILSFESELGLPFPIKLEANHVIEDKQVWVGAIGHGPNGNSLQAVYKSMETWSFQDELGSLILNVCQTVPHGVLCFMPSYKAVEKFRDRWQTTGVWEKIQKRKRVIVEPRSSEKVDFEALMKSFYKTIKTVEDEGETEDGLDGALFIAVCRGKVSEGLDFADNNARAVITVGIPYPNFKDIQVKLKREYNDMHKNARGLLSGSEWYEIQAFRALNQALGRCIRHRKDWGALILVDERFVKNTGRYCKGLSKWVRNKVQPFNSFRMGMDSLASFTKCCMEDMPVISMDTSFIPCTPSTPAGPNKSYNLNVSPLTPGSNALQRSILNTCTSPNDSLILNSPPSVSMATRNEHNESKQYPRSKQMILSPTEVHQSQHLQTAVNQKQVIATKTQTNVNTKFQLQIANQGPMAQVAMQQVLQVINSPNTPKDKPYYVILNEGTPQQQMYLIEPPKKPPLQIPPSTINSQVTSPSGSEGISTGKKMQSLLGTGTNNVLNSSIANNCKTSDKSVSDDKSYEKGAINSPDNRNCDTVKSSLTSTVNELVKEENNTSLATESYLKSCDGVQSSETEKKQASNEAESKETSSAVSNSRQVTDQKPTPSKGQSLVKSPQTPTLFDGENREMVDATDKSSYASDIVTNLNFEDGVNLDTPNKVQPGVMKKPLFKKRSRSIATPAEPQFDDSNNDFKKPRLSLKRKSLTTLPLPRDEDEILNTSSRAEELPEEEVGTDMKIVSKACVKEDQDLKSEQSILDGRGNGIQKGVEQGESERERTEDSKDCQMGEKAENHDVEDVNESVQEETLNVRRSKRGVKRKSYLNGRSKAKRSKAEDDFLDHIVNDKENKSQLSMPLTCAKCGSAILSSSKEYERSKLIPKFLRNVTKQEISEVISCRNAELGKSVQALTTNVQGIMLNSVWDADSGCCVQLLQCTGCAKSQHLKTKVPVVGAKLLCIGNVCGSKEYHVGQTWLFAPTINLRTNT